MSCASLRLKHMTDNADKRNEAHDRKCHNISPFCYGLLLDLVYICQSYRKNTSDSLIMLLIIIIHYNNGDKTTSGLSAVLFFGLLFSKISNIESKYHEKDTRNNPRNRQTQHTTFSQHNVRFYGRHVES